MRKRIKGPNALTAYLREKHRDQFTQANSSFQLAIVELPYLAVGPGVLGSGDIREQDVRES